MFGVEVIVLLLSAIFVVFVVLGWRLLVFFWSLFDVLF